jgi:hypothetical protein
MNCQIFNSRTWNWPLLWQTSASTLKKKRIIHCKLYTVKSAQVIPFRPRLFTWRNIVLSSAHQHSNDSNTRLCECIVQRRYLFFVRLCFDNIMSIIMKVSYMKSNNCMYYLYVIWLSHIFMSYFYAICIASLYVIYLYHI